MAKGKVKVQTDKPSVWDKTIGFIKDKIYDAKVAIHKSLFGGKEKKPTKMSSKAKKDLIFYLIMMAYPVAYFLIFYVGININSILLAFKTYEIDTITGQQYTIWSGFANFTKIFNEYTSSTLLSSALKNSIVVYLYGLLMVPLGLLFSYYIAKKAVGHEFFRVMLFLPSILSALILVILYKYIVERLYPALMLEVFGKQVTGLLANPDTRFGALLFYNLLTSFGTSVLIYSSTMDRIPESIIEIGRAHV